jgi:hypothetical protein
MNTFINQFEELWEDYISSFKGSLISQTNNQPMSYHLAKRTLEEVTLSWLSEFDRRGRWVMRLEKEFPDKGDVVKDIIRNDISIKEIASSDSHVSASKYLLPAGLAAVGYFAAKLLAYNPIKTACLVLIPALISVPILNNHLKNRQKNKEDAIIDSYVNQLNKYKVAILEELNRK